jgi:hypothetical protein
MRNRTRRSDGIQVPFTMEEDIYDIFRGIFHIEEDVLAATIQLFRGDPIDWDEGYLRQDLILVIYHALLRRYKLADLSCIFSMRRFSIIDF